VAIYFLNVPQSFIQVFSQSGINPISIDKIPVGEQHDTIIWYAKTETDIMLFEQMYDFGRKIILGAETLKIESPSIIALLLRQSYVEMYYPFLASHITNILGPERHWFEYQEIKNNKDPDVENNAKIEMSVTKESIVGTIMIAVANLQHGSGSTHTALTIAKFLSSKGFRVAVVELKQTSDYGLVYLQRKTSNNQFSYKYDSFDIYANDGEVTPDDLFIFAMSKNYNYIVFDMGLLFERNLKEANLDKPGTDIKKYNKGFFYNEFMKADMKIITSFASTQFADSIEYFLNYLNVWDITDLKILFNFTNEETLKKYKRLLDSKCFLLPFNTTLTLYEEQYVFFDRLLCKIIPKERIIEERSYITNSIKNLIHISKKFSKK